MSYSPAPNAYVHALPSLSTPRFRVVNAQDVCEGGGETFQTIFGARTPLIESFLIKRKLMGPCWLTVRDPKVCRTPGISENLGLSPRGVRSSGAVERGLLMPAYSHRSKG